MESWTENTEHSTLKHLSFNFDDEDEQCENCGKDDGVASFKKGHSFIVVCKKCFDIYEGEGFLKGFKRA